MLKKFILGLLLATGIASAALVETDRALVDHVKNILDNPGFENGKARWTASGGTFTVSSTGKAFGVAGALFDASSASQTLTSTAVAIPEGLKSKNAVVSCAIKTVSGSATHKLQAYDGTNVVAESVIASSTTTFLRTSVNFAAPSSGNLSARIIAVAADEPQIYVDDCVVGLADGFNLSQFNQTTFVGAVTFPGATSCSWARTSNATFGAYAADSDCVLPTGTNVEGSVAAPATKYPSITLKNVTPGTKYRLEATGFFNSSTVNAACSYRFSDGTTSSTPLVLTYGTAGSVDGAGVLVGDVTFTTGGDKAMDIQTTGLDGNYICNLDNGWPTTAAVRIAAYKFPSVSETVYRPEITNWKVDASITGTDFNTGSAAVVAYSEMTDAGQTLVNNSVSGAVTAQIACATGNPSTGTTCAVGNESNGIAFTPLTTGDAEVCATFNSVAFPNAVTTTMTFQIAETTNTSSAITTSGKTRSTAGGYTIASRADFYDSHRVCDVFPITSLAQKTYRLEFIQGASPVTDNRVTAADSGIVTRWTVRPLTQNFTMPVIVGGTPTVQRFLSGSGTYTKPSAVRYLKVRLAAGGGGGSGSISGAGGAGGNTSFTNGVITLQGNAGSGAAAAGNGGAGGTVSNTLTGDVSILVEQTGPDGGGSAWVAGDAQARGGDGGSTPFAGAGLGGGNGTGSGPGKAAQANTGSGGGGGATRVTANNHGAGGGAGGYVEAIIKNPTNFTYSVGTGGTGGTGAAGTSAAANGGAGGSGVIIVEEYYQ